MNTTEVDKEALLDELNSEKAALMRPVIVLLVLMMVAGLLGNGMVCFYYGFKTKRTTSSIFIVVLALFDIITCAIAIPIEIVDLTYFYKFENGGACKAMRFINHFAAFGSVATLLAIAIDRYRKICRPFKKQLSLQNAKILSAVAVGLAVLLSWPACVFYDAVKVRVSTDTGIELIGSDCTTTKDEAYKVTLWAFNLLHLVLFVASVVILVVLYASIGRVLYAHRRQRLRYDSSRPGPSSDHVTTDPIATDSSDLSEDRPCDKKPKEDNRNGTCDKRQSFELAETKSTPVVQNTKQPDLKNTKYTLIMLVITVVFIVSFLPYLILVIWRIFLGRYEGDVLSDSGLVAFQFGIRSYMLNSVINPIAYGFLNSRFSMFFYTTLCPCCSKVSRDITLSSSGS